MQAASTQYDALFLLLVDKLLLTGVFLVLGQVAAKKLEQYKTGQTLGVEANKKRIASVERAGTIVAEVQSGTAVAVLAMKTVLHANYGRADESPEEVFKRLLHEGNGAPYSTSSTARSLFNADVPPLIAQAKRSLALAEVQINQDADLLPNGLPVHYRNYLACVRTLLERLEAWVTATAWDLIQHASDAGAMQIARGKISEAVAAL